MQLNEDITVNLREITHEEREYAESFQEFLQTVLKHFEHDKSILSDFRDYQNFKKDLKRFHNYPWFERVTLWFKKHDADILTHFKDRRAAVRVDLSQIESINNIAEKALKAKNEQAFLSAIQKVRQTATVVVRAQDKTALKYARNPIKVEDPMFFQSNNFLRSFYNSNMQKIVDMDLDTYKYTYLDLPGRSGTNYLFMAHWMMQLQESPEPMELSGDRYVKWTKFVYDTDEFDELQKIVKEYMNMNNKKLIPKIQDMMKKFPSLIQANENLKQQTKTVHRGIALASDEMLSDSDIIKQDKNNKYIATSSQFHTALLFAANVGHVEGLSARRSDEGRVITYSVSPESIILDTSVFGSKFGEGEIIIDATKAQVQDIADLDDHMPNDDYGDDYDDY